MSTVHSAAPAGLFATVALTTRKSLTGSRPFTAPLSTGAAPDEDVADELVVLELELPEFIYTTPPITASNTTTPMPIHIPELDFSSSLPGSNITITSVYSWVIFG